jgi:hypothetical protein
MEKVSRNNLPVTRHAGKLLRAVVVSELEVADHAGYYAVQPIDDLRRHKQVCIKDQWQRFMGRRSDFEDCVRMETGLASEKVDGLRALTNRRSQFIGELPGIDFLAGIRLEASRSRIAKSTAEVAAGEIYAERRNDLDLVRQADVSPKRIGVRAQATGSMFP